jgi:apolipoprotein N-acyltransferase
VAALIAILLASALGYGAWRERTPFGDGGPVKVALLHDATVPGVAPSGAEPESAFARRLGLGRDAAAAGAHLVIWPELSLPRVLDGSGLPDPLEEVFRATSAWWLVGAAVERRRLDGVDRWNSALLFHDARLRGRHDKLDLLPFAEDERASVFLGRTLRGWKRGERLRPLRTEALSIGPLICSEALLPELARAMVQSGATVLANPSYDGWYPTDGAREQALRVAALRAVENRRWLLRSTIGGATAAVDPVGASRPLREPGGPGVVEVTIRNVEEITVYARHGEGPALAAIAVCLGLGVALAYRPRSGGA